MVDLRKPNIDSGPQTPAHTESAKVSERPARPAVTVEARPTREADQFRKTGLLERFVANIRRRVDREGPQSFRLPSGRVVQDRRAERGAGKDDVAKRAGDEKDAAKQLSGSAAPAAERAMASRKEPTGKSGGEAGLPEPAAEAHGTTGAGAAPHAAAGKKIAGTPGQPGPSTKILSEFEAKVLARFESGDPMAQALPDGQPKFLHKSAQQWKEFFKNFWSRTVAKEVAMDALGDAHTFRGLLQKKGEAGTGVLISDLALASGQVEKFTRIELPLAGIAQQMQQWPAGAALPRALLEQQLRAEQVRYLAIRPRGADDAVQRTARETGGMFTTQRTEDAVAAQLGIRVPQTGLPVEAGKTDAAERQRNRNRCGLLDGDLIGDDGRRHVVPPWWAREERTGRRRWFVTVTLGVLLATLVIVGWLVLRGM